MKQEKAVDWSSLPDDILTLLPNKLADCKDYLRFGAVSHWWRSVHAQNLPSYRPPSQLPFLIFTPDQENWSLYRLSDDTVLNLRLQIPHDRISDRCFRPYVYFASSHGWLLARKLLGVVSLDLLNPLLTGNGHIQLPFPFPSDYEVCLGVLSANPLVNPDFLVFAANRKNLAFIKPSTDTTWTQLQRDTQAYTNHHSIIYYKDRIYVLQGCGELLSGDVNHPDPKLSTVVAFTRKERILLMGSKTMVHLVESEGDLFRIANFFNDLTTSGFQVSKLSLDTGSWIEVTSLPRRVVVMSQRSSMSFSSSDFPECKDSRIYFVDNVFTDMLRHEYYAKVFNLEDGTIETLHTGVTPRKYGPTTAPPFWIEPTINMTSIKI